MKIQRIEISNIKAVEFWELRPKSISIISGANGSGKTSRLDALRCIFAGGSLDADWLRKGAREGHAIIELDSGHILKKRVYYSKKDGEIKSDFTVIGPDGIPVPAPATFVDQLATILAVDPVRLLQMPAKRFSEELLKILPIDFTDAEVKAACGDVLDVPAGTFGLDDMTEARKNLYELRKAANVRAKDAEAWVKETIRSLPQVEDSDPKATLAAARKEAEDIRSRIADAKTKIRDASARKIEAINRKADADCDEVRLAAGKAIEEIDQVSALELQAVMESVATLEERAAAHQRATGARSQVEEFRKKARAASLEAEKLNSAMEKLDELKVSKLKNLPVEGLTYENGEFLVDGISWPHVNTARQIDTGLQIAAAMDPELKFLCLDSTSYDSLDSDGRQALQEGAEALGYQIIAAEVSDAPLTVETR